MKPTFRTWAVKIGDAYLSNDGNWAVVGSHEARVFRTYKAALEAANTWDRLFTEMPASVVRWDVEEVPAT